MDRRTSFALLAFGIGALSLGVAASLIQRSRGARSERLIEKMESRLGALRRRTTAFDAGRLVS